MFTSMSARPPATKAPAYLRVAVILGATSLLAGVGGLVWLPDPGAIPAFVRIQGVGELTPQVVWNR